MDSAYNNLPNFEEDVGLPMPTLIGDFYRDEGDVTRGVSLANVAMGPSSVFDDSREYKGQVIGDFYGQEDPTVRGCSLGPDFGLGQFGAADEDLKTSSWNVGDSVICRDAADGCMQAPEAPGWSSFSLHGGSEMRDLHEAAYGSNSNTYYAPPGFQRCSLDVHVAMIVDHSSSMAAGAWTSRLPDVFVRFSNADRALLDPMSDKFFTFEPTTLYMRRRLMTIGLQEEDVNSVEESERWRLAGKIMNVLWDFLGTQVADITKVNPKKCCIKAKVYKDNVPCTFKARCYEQQETKTIAVEIQKRSGDSLAFSSVFVGASKYLEQNLDDYEIIGGMPKECIRRRSLSPDPPEPTEKVDLRDYGPLLDMARQGNAPFLQAEAAQSLASLATDPLVAEALCSEPHAMQDVEKLLEAVSVDVAVPTAALVSKLAQSSNAVEPVRMLLKKIQSVDPKSHEAPHFARQQFAKALADATPACRRHLSEQMASQLAEEVKEVMSKSSGLNHSVQGMLEQARDSLLGLGLKTAVY